MAENNQATTFTPESLMTGLTNTCAPMTISGVMYSETTDSLAAKIVDMIDETMGIHEIDHCLLHPRKDNRGDIVEFDAVLYFNTAKTAGKTSHIYKLGAKGGNRFNNDGRPNLMRFVGGRTSFGNFDISEDFKRAISPFARLDDRGNIIIHGTDVSPNVAVVECHFFRLLSLVLNISSTDNYDFSVADCQPMNNRDDCMVYRLLICKEILPDAGRRRSRSGIDYGAMDRKRIQRRNR